MNTAATISLLTGLLGALALSGQNDPRPAQVAGVLTVAPSGPAEEIPADLSLESGHTKPVTALSFSPDGVLLASGSQDNTVRLWDPVTGRQRKSLKGHTAPVRSLAFSPDGALLASGSDDRTIRIWEVASGRLWAALQGPTAPATALSFSPDGKRLVSGGGSAVVWDVAASAPVRALEGNAFEFSTVFFSPDSAKVITATQFGDMEIRGVVKTYDAVSGKLLETRSEVLRAAGADGNAIAIQQGQWGAQTIQLFQQGANVGSFSGNIGQVVFNRAGDWAAYSVQPSGDVVVRRSVDERSGATIAGDNRTPAALALSPDGSRLATATDMIIKLWDIPTGRLSQALAPQFGVNALAFSPDSKRIVSVAQGNGEGAVRIWDLATATELRRLPVQTAGVGAAIGPDGNLLAIGARTLTLWDLRSGARIREFRCPGDVVISPAFSSNGRLLAGNCRGVITVWDTASGAPVFQAGRNDAMSSGAVGFSPDGRFLAAGAGQDGLTLYDLAAGRSVRAFSIRGNLSALAFSSDGRTIVAGTRVPLRLKVMAQGSPGFPFEPVNGQLAAIAAWDVSAGRQLFSVPAGHWVAALAFRADGSSFLAVSGNVNSPGMVSEYETSTGRKIATLVDRVDAPSAAAFSPDRAWLAGGGGFSGAVKLWKLAKP